MTTPFSESLKPPKERLVSWLARLYHHRLTTTTGGSLSFLDDDGVLYITPSGGDKAIVPPEKVSVCKPTRTPAAVITLDGDNEYEYEYKYESFEGPAAPSMEWRIHTGAYMARSGCKAAGGGRGGECRAVLHAHSMALIAFSLARDSGSVSSRQFHSSSDTGENHAGVPDTRCLLSAWLNCGRVCFVPYYPPGSIELAVACAKALSKADCAILQNHGVVTVGSTLQEAFNRFVTLEYLAQSIFSASQIGVPIPLKEHALDVRRDEEGRKFLLPIDRCPGKSCCGPRRKISGGEKEKRAELCTFVKRAYDQRLFTASSGAMSIRIHGGATTVPTMDEDISFVISPTHVDRSNLSSADICSISNHECFTMDCMYCNDETTMETCKCVWHADAGQYQQDETRPSHTTEIHETIYKMHPEVNCIIIAQPHYATSFCITGTPLNAAGIPESHLVVGHVQTLPFESLENAGIAIARALNPSEGRTSVLITGFGMLSVGVSAMKTFVQVEVCESICGVLLTALRRGPPVLLSNDQVKEIDFLWKSH